MSLTEQRPKLIRDLSFQKLNNLSAILDIISADGKPGWETLISKMPSGTYTSTQVGTFRLASMRLGGSPSYDLLTDMGFRGRTVDQLVSYLERMECEEGLFLVKPQEGPTMIKHPAIESSIGPEDSEIQLECQAIGLPFPSYKWFKGKEPVVEVAGEVEGIKEAKLTFKKAKPHHNGQYCCRAMNRHGHVFSNWIEVRVSGKPRTLPDHDPTPIINADSSTVGGPTITLHPQSTSIPVGSEYLLKCTAHGQEPLSYQWYKNGREMLNGQGMHLLLNRVQVAQSGEYFCKVVNSIGTALSNRAIIQIVQGTSDPTTFLDSVRITEKHIDRAVTMRCSTSVPSPVLWFKDENMLPDPRSNEWILKSVQLKDCGIYSCKSIEGMTLVPQSLSVEVVPPLLPEPSVSPSERTKFGKCRGKVALLIGNQRYQAAELTRLRQPHNDVASLAGKLTSLGFQCVTLIDTSKDEMEQAFTFFQRLLVCGVYAVFYFAGHGFEENGENYLVPVDAHEGFSLHECVKAQSVLKMMQDRDTALNFLILDMCRKPREEELPETGTPRIQESLQNNANTIISYACNPQYEAYESKRLAEDNGIFMTHFLQHVGKIKRVEEILMDVNTAVNAARPETIPEEKWQKPSYVSSLARPVSLHDEVMPDDGTFGPDNDFSSALHYWTLAHTIPEPLEVRGEFLTDQVKVLYTFNAEFSNVLLIHVNVSYPPPVKDMNITLSAYGPDGQKYIVTDVKNQSSPYGSRAVSGSQNLSKPLFLFKIEKLQRVRGMVTFSLSLAYNMHGVQRAMGMIESTIEPPLIAKLYKYFKD